MSKWRVHDVQWAVGTVTRNVQCSNCIYRHRDGDRSIGKHRNIASSSSTYALAPVYCPDSQQTTTTDTSGFTIVPHSPSKARTLPPRVGSPSPRTCRRLQVVGYSPVRQQKFIVDGGVNAVTMPRFKDLDVWKTTHDHGDLSVLPPHLMWTDTDLPPPPPPSTTTWQRCSCSAGPPPPLTTPGPGRVRRTVPPPSSTLASTPTSFSTFKPSPATSPAGVESSCPITLRPDRCGDAEQTTTTRPQQGCHAMSLHLHVKHDTPCPDNSPQQSVA